MPQELIREPREKRSSPGSRRNGSRRRNRQIKTVLKLRSSHVYTYTRPFFFSFLFLFGQVLSNTRQLLLLQKENNFMVKCFLARDDLGNWTYDREKTWTNFFFPSFFKINIFLAEVFVSNSSTLHSKIILFFVFNWNFLSAMSFDSVSPFSKQFFYFLFCTLLYIKI